MPRAAATWGEVLIGVWTDGHRAHVLSIALPSGPCILVCDRRCPAPRNMDLYQVLELTHNADAAAIRAAYRTLAKRYHPDVSELPDAHARFIAITEAYEVLGDPQARERYDHTQASPSPKRASAATEARYARDTQARQRSARTKAEEYVRMPYEQFDADVFDSVAAYVVPKMLGCFGIGLLATLGLIVLLVLASQVDGLGRPLAVLAAMGFIPGIVYASMLFDEWHNRRQIERKRRSR